MIQALQILPQALTSNTDDINFTTVDLRTGSASCNGWLQYNPGSSNFTLIGGGVFEITFNANVTSASTGQVAIALKSGGSDIEGTEMDEQITTANTYRSISMSKVIRVCPKTNTTISVGSLPAIGGVTPAVSTQIPIIKDANFVIRRIA
ncbi:MAG: hypothetical protein IKU37_01205 [Candidatus Gastranaerophilales bacterium]|nr:hypothetical protein [Candidatus Gastranaerophilales bacterium]